MPEAERVLALYLQAITAAADSRAWASAVVDEAKLDIAQRCVA
jgi:hypothetical protein